ncbi:hypothetical protein MRX96_035817 [Rhipicephalus microplus]
MTSSCAPRGTEAPEPIRNAHVFCQRAKETTPLANDVAFICLYTLKLTQRSYRELIEANIRTPTQFTFSLLLHPTRCAEISTSRQFAAPRYLPQEPLGGPATLQQDGTTLRCGYTVENPEANKASPKPVAGRVSGLQ